MTRVNERSTISQIVQLGVEAEDTPGTPVTATVRLNSMSIEPTINANVNRFRPQGSKYESVAALGKEWTTAAVQGVATYDEIVYALSSVLTKSDAVTSGATTESEAKTWVFRPATYAADLPVTYTIEHGSTEGADSFAYGLFQEFGIDINRDTVQVSGSMIGHRMTVDGVTLATEVADLPQVPILPTAFDVYLDTLLADIGETKLGRVLTASWKIGSRSNPLWVVDSSETSWINHVETQPSLEVQMLVEADSDGMAFLDQMRSGATKYLRIQATGPLIPGTVSTHYKLIIDMPVKIVATGGFSDADGVYAISWTFTGVNDNDLNGSGVDGALKVTVVNSIASLADPLP